MSESSAKVFRRGIIGAQTPWPMERKVQDSLLRQTLQTNPMSTTSPWQKHTARKSTASCGGTANGCCRRLGGARYMVCCVRSDPFKALRPSKLPHEHPLVDRPTSPRHHTHAENLRANTVISLPCHSTSNISHPSDDSPAAKRWAAPFP